MFRFLFGNQRPVSPARPSFRPSFRPQLEILEGRTLPSGFGPQTFVHNEPAQPAQIFIHNVTASHFTSAPGTAAAQQVSGAGATSGQNTAAIAEQVLGFVNEERKNHNLPELKVDLDLTRAAQQYATLQAQRHTELVNKGFSDVAARPQDNDTAHRFDGKHPYERAWAEGFPEGKHVGEVVHAGPNINAEQAVRGPTGWINTPDGHQQEVLNPSYTWAGVGVAYSSTGVPYYVMDLGVSRT